MIFRMNKNMIITGLLLMILFTGCKEDWDKHYNDPPDTIDRNVWDVIQEDDNMTLFVQYVKEFKLDTLFLKDDTWTLFIPDNTAFSGYLDTAQVTPAVLQYLISPAFIQAVVINGKRKVQTLGEKFALFERDGGKVYLDGYPVAFESPLYRNGKFFILNRVGIPRPNLYEYITINNPALKIYIDSKDSIILDKEKSRPIGFDSNGNTIYDSVAVIFNKFEARYFPVSEEFRSKTATLVFPGKEDYNNALTEMAQTIGSGYTDYRDIPGEWQQNILIPYLLVRGVFENMMEPEEFIPNYSINDTFKLKNILGDSIMIEYGVKDKVICSNGYAYKYDAFSIPDTLFAGAVRYEGEWLLDRTGIDKFSWKDSVAYISDLPFPPVQENIKSASNDSILKVSFSTGYSGQFSIEFKVKNLFPRKYLMVVKTLVRIGGIYDIYVNDDLVKSFDYKKYTQYPKNLLQSVTGKYYVSDDLGYNKFDCWVQNDADYGKATVRFEYMGPTIDPTKTVKPGLVIDYIDFIPY